jgi:hypothetical protein
MGALLALLGLVVVFGALALAFGPWAYALGRSHDDQWQRMHPDQRRRYLRAFIGLLVAGAVPALFVVLLTR